MTAAVERCEVVMVLRVGWLCLLACLAAAAWAGPLDGVRIDPTTVVGTPGYFRVGRSVNGYWWLLGPDGKPFYYRGVTSINRAGTQGGRRAKPGPYAEAVDAKYGYQDGPDAFVETTLARVRGWGLNGLGAWCTEEFFDRGMPYTEITEFSFVGPYIWSVDNGRRGTPDVFDPAWHANIDAKAKAICAPRRNSTQLVGYFTDNEIGFFEMVRPDRHVVYKVPTIANTDPYLLQRCLSLPDEQPAAKAAWAFVLERHGDLAGVSAAWNVPLPDRAAVAALSAERRALVSPAYERDDTAFVSLWAREYFRRTSEAIRRHDPNHLILGCRWGGPPSAAVLAEMQRPYVDVVSANNYQGDFAGRMDIYARLSGMPILNGEFSWAGWGRVRGTDEAVVRAAYDRVAHGAEVAMHRVYRHPQIIGWTWYRWVQDGTPFSYGLVNTKDEPHPFNIALLWRMNQEAEALRAAADAPPAPAARPLHAALAITLEDAEVREDATAIRYGSVGLTVTCREGQWDPAVTGGRVGTVVDAAVEGDAIRLTVAVRKPRALATTPEDRYTVTLTQRGGVLTGRYTGTYQERPVAGEARGYADTAP